MTPLVTATAAHAEAMAAIHEAAFAPGARWGKDAMALQLELPGSFSLIDPEGGFVLARVVADEAEVLTLAVVPGLRRSGRARRLLEAAHAAAAMRGAIAMFLEVATANAAARALYAGAGYGEVGRRRGYYGPGGDALVLRRVLTPGGPAAA